MHDATAQATERAAAPAEELVAQLEISPPDRIAVGRGNAFVVGGYCYHPSARTLQLELEVGGERTPVRHLRLPRADRFERVASAAGDGDPGEEGARAFRSGFVAIARLGPRADHGEAELRLEATLEGRGRASASVGSLRLDPGLAPPDSPQPPFPAGAEGRVAICMATYDPPRELLRRQLDSLREQTHPNWICLISDDRSDPAALEALRAEVAGDDRFAISRSDRRLGFYSNFERALSMAPASADFVALCDQDDRWHPAKLERLLERMEGGVELAYSDARVVDPSGEVVHPSYWTTRRNNYTNLASLLVANTVTGAASLFRRELLDDVLPFPPRVAEAYHDHWLSLVALARGRISYVEEPLYDYVQHPGAVIGHAKANRKPVPIRERLRERLRNPGDGSRTLYYYNWSQQQLFAEVLRTRCWGRMSASKRRALGRFQSADTSLRGVGWLLARLARRLWGRSETMGIERHYAKALLRQRAVSARAIGRSRPPRWLPRDAAIPPAPGEMP